MTVGSMATQGGRQADAELGDRIAVIGLALVGQLTCRLLSAAGCEVIGIDLAADLVKRAQSSGLVGFLRSEPDRGGSRARVGNCVMW